MISGSMIGRACEYSVTRRYLQVPLKNQSLNTFGERLNKIREDENVQNSRARVECSRKYLPDSDQRTRETGKALAAALAPGCAIEVSALHEGTADPLFHPLSASIGSPDHVLAAAAIAGRIGGNPQEVVEAYCRQHEALEKVLLGCNLGGNCNGERGPAPKSIFDIPSSLASGRGGHLGELRTPLGTAASTSRRWASLCNFTSSMYTSINVPAMLPESDRRACYFTWFSRSSRRKLTIPWRARFPNLETVSLSTPVTMEM
jgi:hypothetical protein